MSSRVDPNVYALSIQLSLESTEAFATLDAFSKNITDLETELSSAAQKSMMSIANVADEASRGVEDISKAFAKMGAITAKVNIDLTESTKEIKEQFDTGEEHLDNIQEIHDLMEKMQKIQIDMGEELDKHLKVNTAFLKGTEGIIKAVRTKNDAHREQNKLLENDVNAAKSMNSELRAMNSEVGANTISWRQIEDAAGAVWRKIREIDADTEKFTTTNYRAYGSQQSLVQGARNLAMETGVLYENAVQAYQVLGNLKVPKEEIDKYAKAIGEANRFTGASIQTLGIFSQRIMGSGQDATAAERQLKYMGEAMRKFGLNTEDVNKIIGDTTVSGAQLKLIFSNKDAVQGIDNIKSSLMSINKELGQSTDVGNNYINMLNKDAIARLKLSQLTGVQIKTTDDLAKAVSKAGKAITDQGYDVDEVLNGTSEQAQITRKALADVYTGGDEEALLMLLRTSKLTDEFGKEVATVNDLQAALSKANDSDIDPFKTLTAQLNILKSTVWSIIGSVLQLAADAIMPLVKALNWLIRQFTALIGWIQQADALLRKHIPGYQTFAAIVKWVVGIVIALGIGFLFVAGAIGTFSTVFSGFSGIITGAGRVVTSIGSMIVQMAGFIGQAIKILLTAIGEGLAAMGKAVQPVIGPLLGLGLAFLLVGVGAYFFAMALQIVVQQGTAAIPAVIGMIIVIAILGLVLIGLAMLVQGPVAVGLVVLAVAFIAVGLAALLTGLGLMYAGVGVQMLAGALSFKLIIQIGLLGLVLVSLGMMALVAFPGIMALSVVMVILALAALLLVGSMSGLSDQLKQLSGAEAGNIAEVGTQFLIAGLSFIIAAMTMLAASVIFAVAAPMLMVAIAIMLAATNALIPMAGFFIVGSMLLLIASLVFFVAVMLLVPSSMLFIESAILIFAGSMMMLMGASLIIEGSLLLAIGGALLGVAGLALWVGLLFMSDAASDIFDVGMKIGVGGMMMLVGAQSIVAAATMFQSSADYINSALGMLEGLLPKLGSAALELRFGSLMLILGARDLSLAGRWLVPAAFSIYFGMRWLEYAIDRFMKTLENVEKIAKAVVLLAASFDVLSKTNTASIKETASNALDAVPNIEKLADRLLVAASKLDAAVDSFAGPADRLTAVFERLGNATASFNAGIKVTDDIAKLADMLDKYATLLEGTTARIEAAVKSRAIPAMKVAEEIGIEESIRSEAITTVQVMDETEGNVSDDRQMEAQIKMIDLLQSLDGRLEAMQTNNKGEVADILSLLQSYLPNAGKGDSGLGSEFNAWSK